MEFVKVPLVSEIEVTHLVSLHYFEFAKGFIFEGESHDFWELLYVDKGEIEVTADTSSFVLGQGDIIFHKPNEFHSVWANRKSGPNIIVVCFECHSETMRLFENKLFCLNDTERNWMAGILKHGFAAYTPPFDLPRVHDLIKREGAPFAAEQLLRIHLELLLLSLAERAESGQSLAESRGLSLAAMERNEDELLKRALSYMEQHVHSDLTLDQLCARLHIGQSRLSELFKRKAGQSVMKTYKGMKIEAVKLAIREERFNFTEIAEQFGYTSIHTFSRHFKNAVGMTPSEYAKSVKARVP